MSLGAVLILSLLAVVSLALFLVVLRASGSRRAPTAPDLRSERDAVIGEEPGTSGGRTGRFTRPGSVPQREAEKALAGSPSGSGGVR